MKKVLRIVSAQAFLLLSFNAYAQSDTRGYDTHSEKEKIATKKSPIAQVSSSSEKKSKTKKKTRNVVPDIRREIADQSIALYPNPVVDKLLVEVDLDEWQGGTVTIKNRSGRKIVQQRITDASLGFNLRSVNRGVYLLTVRKGGSEKTVEVIKL